MSSTHEDRRPAGQGHTHSLAMVLVCVVSVAALVGAFALGVPTWLVLVVVLVCPLVLLVVAYFDRRTSDAEHGRLRH